MLILHIVLKSRALNKQSADVKPLSVFIYTYVLTLCVFEHQNLIYK